MIPSGIEIFEVKPATHVTQQMRSAVRADRNSNGLRSATERTAITAGKGLHPDRMSASHWQLDAVFLHFPVESKEEFLARSCTIRRSRRRQDINHISRGNHAETAAMLSFTSMSNPASWQDNQFTSHPLTAVSAHGRV
jgi:hypothetical protein